MISKQGGAFLAGMIVVAASIGAFMVYDQQKGSEYQVDADDGSGDKTVSSDPTSGFTSYGGQKYYLYYKSLAYALATNYSTTYTVEFDSNGPGLVKAYVNNIQVTVGNNFHSKLYFDGQNKITMTTSSTDQANAGLELVKDLQFSFEPLTEKSGILGYKSNTLYSYGYLPSSGHADLYQGNTLKYSFELDGSNTYSINSVSLTTPITGSNAILHLVVGNDLYQVSIIS